MIREWAIPCAVLAASAAAWVAFAGDQRAVPDSRITPGAIASTSTAEICAPGYDKAHRVWHDKYNPDPAIGTLAKYHIPFSEGRNCEDDDLVPVCGGGDNANPFNHWCQPWPQARDKDKTEAQMCQAVCEGRMPLSDLQQYFLSWGR